VTESILISGANRGIGLELVRQYAVAGWRVYAACRKPEAARELNDLAQRSAGAVSVHPLDVTNQAQRAALAAALGDSPVDILFNNAAVYGPQQQEFGENDEQAWLDALRINSIAPLKLIETLVDNVARSHRKLIVGMTSKMGSMADNHSGGSYIYRSTKAALNAVLTSAAIDLQPRGITVLMMHPGWVKTDMGGPGALITTQQCVASMRVLLSRVTLADTGRFYQYDGAIVPW
jgi:NAD(P)-dependent dehydrogenase (short-subunit alcohol dehydrogenase family)